MAPTPPSEKAEVAPAAVLDAASGPEVRLPAGFSLLALAFGRAGDDLVLTAPDGRVILVRDFFAVPVPPDLVDAEGNVLAGEIVARLAEGELTLSPEELAAITGFVTAAGGDAQDGFDVDVLEVTLLEGDAPFDAPGLPTPSLARFEYEGPAHGFDYRSFLLTAPETDGPAPAAEAPSRIKLLAFDGRAWEVLVPDAADIAESYYRNGPAYTELRLNAPDRQFFAPDGGELLRVSAASIVAAGFAGSPGNAWDDVLAFVNGADADAFGGIGGGPAPAADAPSDRVPVDGAVVRTSVEVPAGHTLLADVLFDRHHLENASPVDKLPRDFAFAAADGATYVFAENADTLADGATGWLTLAIRDDADGISALAFGVVNGLTNLNAPVLLVDRVRIEPDLVWGAPGETVSVGGETLQFVRSDAGVAPGAARFGVLVQPPAAGDDFAVIDENGVIDSRAGPGVPGLLDNDQAPSPSLILAGGQAETVKSWITAVTVPGGGGNAITTPLTVPQTGPLPPLPGEPALVVTPAVSQQGHEGLLTVYDDGAWRFETGGDFGALEAGETDTVSFTYTLETPAGGTDTGLVTIAVTGVGGPQLLEDFENFENDVVPGSAEIGTASIVTGYSGDPFQGQPGLTAAPVSGTRMLRLDSVGFFAQPLVKPFLGIDSNLPLRDPVDGSVAVQGSAFKLEAVLEPGQRLSFHWSFDNAEIVQGTNPPQLGSGLNDFALFTVTDSVTGNLETVRFADGRSQRDLTGTFAGHLEHHFSTWAVPAGVTEARGYTFGWAIFDETSDPLDREAGNSVLLVDRVEVHEPGPIDAIVPAGYTSVPLLSDGEFQTFAPPTA